MSEESEWLATGEVGRRLGYCTSWYLVQRLEALGVPCLRLTPKSPRRWHWPTIEQTIVPRGTVAKDRKTTPTVDDAA